MNTIYSFKVVHRGEAQETFCAFLPERIAARRKEIEVLYRKKLDDGTASISDIQEQPFESRKEIKEGLQEGLL